MNFASRLLLDFLNTSDIRSQWHASNYVKTDTKAHVTNSNTGAYPTQAEFVRQWHRVRVGVKDSRWWVRGKTSQRQETKGKEQMYTNRGTGTNTDRCTVAGRDTDKR